MIIEKKFSLVNGLGEIILSIGQKIKEEREKKALSQDALSKILPTSRKTIVNWEMDISAPDAKQLEIMYMQGFDVHYIITGNRMPLFASQDVSSYESIEVQSILEAFSIADGVGKATLIAVAELIKSKGK